MNDRKSHTTRHYVPHLTMLYASGAAAWSTIMSGNRAAEQQRQEQERRRQEEQLERKGRERPRE